MKISILEPGAWGTTLGILLSQENNNVWFWYKNPKLSSKISKLRENEKLPNVKIPKKIFISSDLKKVIKNTDLIIIASPSFNFRKTLSELKKYSKLISITNPKLLGIAKGLEKETLKFPSQITEEFFPQLSYAHLSGPGFAREIARGKPANEVIASKDKILLEVLKEKFQIKPLKIEITDDLIGIQLAGALKNALSIGISLVESCLESPERERVQQKLVKWGLKEMIKIGEAIGAKRESCLGPAGLEDLVLTSSNSLSRNFQFGKALYSDAERMRKEIAERKITVEGFDSVYGFYNLGKIYKLNLPMINEIYKVIYRKVSPKKTVKNLLDLE